MQPAKSMDDAPVRPTGSVVEIFRVFLMLGLTSFGGPIAHLGYFREEFVRRRAWLDEAHFAQLLAVCQFLPGPASSQMGFAIGLFRGGVRGALAAFLAFTLPSAVLMFGFAALALQLEEGIGRAVVHGLKLVAVAVVAHGVLGMARQLTPDLPRILIAAAATALIVLTGNAWMQLAAIATGGVLGPWFCRQVAAPSNAIFPVTYGQRTAAALLVLFLVGLACALLMPAGSAASATRLAAAFYQAGALVFGGGHVVLPLLQHSVVESGWIPQDTFLAGYGAAQAVPGPMFTLSAFLGAEVELGLPAAAGAAWRNARGRPARWPASTRRWSGCCWRRSTTRCGPRVSADRSISRSRWPGSCCWRPGGCPHCGSWPGASRRRSRPPGWPGPRHEYSCRCPALHEHAVDRVQADVDQQADPEHARAPREGQRAVGQDGWRGVQRVEADAATSRCINRVRQQMIEVDQPAGQQNQPRAEPALRIPDGREQSRDDEMQQQMHSRVRLHRGKGVGQELHGEMAEDRDTAFSRIRVDLTRRCHLDKLRCCSIGYRTFLWRPCVTISPAA